MTPRGTTMTQDHEVVHEQNNLHHTAKVITETASLSGLRLFFNICVVFLHALLFLTFPLDHPPDVNKILTGSIPSYLLSAITTLGSASVDIFFLISGFLLKSAFAKAPPTFASSIRYIILRYLRLAPAYLVIALTLRAAGAPNCLTVSEFFLLRFGDSRKQCIGVGWSTQVDFVSHILLLPVLRYPQILSMIVFLTPALRLFTWLQQGKPYFPMPAMVTDFIETPEELADLEGMLGLKAGNFSLTDADIYHRRSMVNAYYPLYFGLPCRIAAVAAGVLVYLCMQNKTAVYRMVRRFPVVSLVCTTLVWGFYYSVERFLITSPLAQLIHHSASRISVAMATSIVIMLTCSVEDTPSKHRISQILHGILTWRPVAFLERFSYVVYLLHVLAVPVLVLVPPKFNTDRFTAGWVSLLAFKLYFVTILIGLPVWGIERLALRGRSWLRAKVYFLGKDAGEAKKDL